MRSRECSFRCHEDTVVKGRIECSEVNNPDIVENTSSSTDDVVTPLSHPPNELERIRTVKRHDCDCVGLLEKVDGRFFKYLD
jgi:hypothetical protein